MNGIRKVGVLGAGLMGSGIAEVCAKAGFDVVVREVDEKALAAGRRRIEQSLSKAIERGKLDAKTGDEIRGRLRFSSSLEEISSSDLVIEAIVENLEAKREVYSSALDGICAPQTIFCSNTSSLTIAEIAAGTKRPDRFAGLHFFNPVPVMKLVEVVRAIETSDDTIARVTDVRALARQGAHRGSRQLRIRGEPAARAVPPRRDPRPRAGGGLARGHRHGNEAGLRPSHGPVRAARLRRARHGVRDRGDHVRRVPRGAVRAAASPQAHGAGGPLREKERTGILRIRREGNRK